VDKCHSPRHVGYNVAHLCALCAQDEDEHVAAPRDKRAEREKREILQLARERDTCTSCGVGLKKSGPRWWACPTCRSGCLSPYHPAWVDEDDEGDGGPSTKE
jgi:tRNA(Ile2) C34 agmatinyltransferase TiaS